MTTLGFKQVNDPVNLESDLIGKYVERLLQERGQLPKPSISIVQTTYRTRADLIGSGQSSGIGARRNARDMSDCSRTVVARYTDRNWQIRLLCGSTSGCSAPAGEPRGR